MPKYQVAKREKGALWFLTLTGERKRDRRAVVSSDRCVFFSDFTVSSVNSAVFHSNMTQVSMLEDVPEKLADVQAIRDSNDMYEEHKKHKLLGNKKHKLLGNKKHKILGIKKVNQSDVKLESDHHQKLRSHSHEKLGSNSHEKSGSHIHEKGESHSHYEYEGHCHGKSDSHSNEKGESRSHDKLESHSNEKGESQSHDKSESHSNDKGESQNNNESHMNNNESHVNNNESYVNNNESHVNNDESHVNNDESHVNSNESHVKSYCKSMLVKNKSLNGKYKSLNDKFNSHSDRCKKCNKYRYENQISKKRCMKSCKDRYGNQMYMYQKSQEKYKTKVKMVFVVPMKKCPQTLKRKVIETCTCKNGRKRQKKAKRLESTGYTVTKCRRMTEKARKHMMYSYHKNGKSMEVRMTKVDRQLHEKQKRSIFSHTKRSISQIIHIEQSESAKKLRRKNGPEKYKCDNKRKTCRAEKLNKFENESNNGKTCMCWLCDEIDESGATTIHCDKCCVWFHLSCSGFFNVTQRLISKAFTWICRKCGHSNYSDTLFNNFGISTDENTFDLVYSGVNKCLDEWSAKKKARSHGATSKAGHRNVRGSQVQDGTSILMRAVSWHGVYSDIEFVQ